MDHAAQVQSYIDGAFMIGMGVLVLVGLVMAIWFPGDGY